MSNDLNSNKQLIDKIQKMAELLKVAKHLQWSNRLENISNFFGEDENTAIRETLSLYGGMGSLNDLVLYTGKHPDGKLNDEFDSLRTAVYELCHARRL